MFCFEGERSMGKIYTDTNALRYLGIACKEMALPLDLRDSLLLSPMAVMELLSQLALEKDAEAAFSTLRAFPNIHNGKASGMLPWSDTAFRVSVFDLPPIADEVIPSLNSAVNDVLDAKNARSVHKLGTRFRQMLDHAKQQKVEDFSNWMKAWRSEGPLSEADHRRAFADSIARSAKVDSAATDADYIVERLNALYLFDNIKIKRAASDKNYNPEKHANDIYDAEFLVYLADPGLHFLTSDKGFRKAEGAIQYRRIHIVRPERLTDASSAIESLRGILSLKQCEGPAGVTAECRRPNYQ
jgi:hypothetical protein